MTIHLSKELEQFVHDAVRAGLYAREDDVIRDALTRLQQSLPHRAASATADAEETAYDVASRAGLIGCIKGAPDSPTDLTEAELADQDIQRRLFAAGLVSEIKPPIRDLTPYRDRKPVPITGEPLSETVIRERR